MTGETPRLCLAPHPPARPREFPPPGAWDTHAHVLAPAPWVTPRSFDPPISTTLDYVDLLDTMGFAYGVIVQVSVHGTDNDNIVEALERHPDRFRGVVAVPPDVALEDLKRLDAIGVRGVRILTIAKGGVLADAAVELAHRVAPLGWHIEFGVHGEDLPPLRPLIDALPTTVVVAHFGGAGVTAGGAPEIAAAIKGILERPERYVKVSAPYRLCDAPWSAMAPLARELVAMAPDNILWGSDWPHVGLFAPTPMPPTEALFDAFCDWIPDPVLRHKILVDNPTRLYGMPQMAAPAAARDD